jgi:predicted transcriptional regulator
MIDVLSGMNNTQWTQSSKLYLKAGISQHQYDYMTDKSAVLGYVEKKNMASLTSNRNCKHLRITQKGLDYLNELKRINVIYINHTMGFFR